MVLGLAMILVACWLEIKEIDTVLIIQMLVLFTCTNLSIDYVNRLNISVMPMQWH